MWIYFFFLLTQAFVGFFLIDPSYSLEGYLQKTVKERR